MEVLGLVSIIKEETKYYLNKNYATDECCWILETAHDFTGRETHTHMYLEVMWGMDQLIEKEKLIEIKANVYWMINYFIKEYYLGMYKGELDELNKEIDGYLKDNKIKY